MQDSTSYSSSQMKINFKYAKTPEKREQGQNQIRWMPGSSSGDVSAVIDRTGSSEKRPGDGQTPSQLSDPYSKRMGRGLTVTTSRKKSDSNLDEKVLTPRRQPSNSAKEVQILRNELNYMRSRLNESQNSERETSMQLKLLKENSQLNNLILEQNIRNYSADMESLQKDKFVKEQEKLVQDNEDLREKLRIQLHKRGHLENDLEKFRNDHYQLSRVKENVEEKTKSNAETPKQVQKRLRQQNELVAMLTGKIAQQETQIDMLKEHSRSLEKSWKNAVEEIKRINVAYVQASSKTGTSIGQEQYDELKKKICSFDDIHSMIEKQLLRISMFVDQFRYLSEKAMESMSTDITIINEFRIRAQELDEIKNILAPEAKKVEVSRVSQDQSDTQTEVMRLKDEIRSEVDEKEKIKQVLLSQIEDLKKERDSYLTLLQTNSKDNAQLSNEIKNLQDERKACSNNGDGQRLKSQLQSFKKEQEITQMRAEQSLRALRTHYELQISGKNKQHTDQQTTYVDQIGRLMDEVKQLKANTSSKQQIQTISEEPDNES